MKQKIKNKLVNKQFKKQQYPKLILFPTQKRFLIEIAIPKETKQI